jgi:hypothetical protein
VTLSEVRCPTCDGSGFVARNDQRFPCPTCSPRTSASAPYLAANEREDGSALRIMRLAAYVVGAAALVALLALVMRLLWK